MLRDPYAIPYNFESERPDQPCVQVRASRFGWEVIRSYVTADGERVTRVVDLFTTEALAQATANRLLAKIGKAHAHVMGRDIIPD